MTRAGIVRIAREVLLTSGAMLGVACILFAIASAAFDLRPLVFRSGSMAPAIETGDLAVSRTVDASSVGRGDIVSVVTSTGTRVTHRVVAVDAAQGDTRRLTLKGDANAQDDDEVYTVDRVDHVLFDVPRAGRVVDALSSPVGLFVLGLYVAAMVAVIVRRGDGSDEGGDAGGGAAGGADDARDGPVARPGGARRAARSGRRRAGSRPLLAAATSATLVVVSPAGAATPWTDTTTVSTAFTTAVVPAPVTSCDTVTVGQVKIGWTAVPGATAYLLRYGTNGGTTETVGPGVRQKTFGGLATSGTFSVQAQIGYGTTTWTSAASNARSYTVLLAAVSLCG